jgi:NIMA (never in mitosis gene a)-related kinase
LRKNAINKFGSDQYNKLYSYLSHHRSKGTTEDVLRKSLVEMLGKEKINDCLIIDEIIFLETMKSDKK